MSIFSQRFNKWLVDQGKEPWSDDLTKALGAAAESTRLFLEKHKGDFVKELQSLGADLANGKQVDPEDRAKALLDRLEKEKSNED